MMADLVDTHITNKLKDATYPEGPSPASLSISSQDPIELIFLGTGTSSSVPTVMCLTASPDKKPCKTCLSTLAPEGKKNIRRNTSAVIRVPTGVDGKKRTVLIDAGKNFQAAAIEWFPEYGLREIDAVLITHAHADAMNGLDDLRGWTLRGAIQDHIDVYVSQDTFREIQRTFPYLVAKEYASGGGDVPEFKWHIVEDRVPFEIKDTGIRITAFLVQHGRLFQAGPPFATQLQTAVEDGIHPYYCFGYIVQDRIVYMSDVSVIPEEAWEVIEGGGPKSVLVIDCLRLQGHTSHMGVREAAAAIRRVGARRSYMTGFSHDVSHEEYVRMGEGVEEGGPGLAGAAGEGLALLRAGLGGEARWVRPAHDGLRIVVGPGPAELWDETYA